MQQSPRIPRRCALLLAGMAFFLVSCASAQAQSAPSNQRALHSIRYTVPEDWTHKEDAIQGYYHYPPDGGILYVSKAALHAKDDENFDEVFEREIGAIGNNLANIEASSYTQEDFRGLPARQMWCTADAAGSTSEASSGARRVPVYTFCFVYNRMTYTFLFAFPSSETCQMEQNYQSILDSIVLPSEALAASQSAASGMEEEAL